MNIESGAICPECNKGKLVFRRCLIVLNNPLNPPETPHDFDEDFTCDNCGKVSGIRYAISIDKAIQLVMK